MSRNKSKTDEVELDFNLNGQLWQDYLEWCDSGYVIRDENGFARAIRTVPSPKGFEIWKQDMNYTTEQVDDE